MKISALVASLVLLGATGAAIAEDSPATTRQKVVAELARARAAGELDFNDATYPLPLPQKSSTLTRAQVKAELLRARGAGEMDYTDATYPLPLPSPPTGLTRQAVSAEAARALAAGELDFSEAAIGTGSTMHAAGAAK